ncbi:MAG: hypothetical protein KDN22_27650 [Verrucomicrobiae bacterium]|nr:hypothetical protein [Verrucomicrobiae bacterium]
MSRGQLGRVLAFWSVVTLVAYGIGLQCGTLLLQRSASLTATVVPAVTAQQDEEVLELPMPHVMFGDITAARSSDRSLREEPVLQMLELEFAEPEQLAELCKVISSLSSDELRSLLVDPQPGYGERSEVIEMLLAVRWMRLDPIGALGDACDFPDLFWKLLEAWSQINPDAAIAYVGGANLRLSQGFALVAPQRAMDFVEANPGKQLWGAPLRVMADRAPERMMELFKREEVKWEYGAPVGVLVIDAPSRVWDFLPVFDFQSFESNSHTVIYWSAAHDPTGAIEDVDRRRRLEELYASNAKLSFDGGETFPKELATMALIGWLYVNPDLTVQEAAKVAPAEELPEMLALHAPLWVKSHFDLAEDFDRNAGQPEWEHTIERRILDDRDNDAYGNAEFDESGASQRKFDQQEMLAEVSPLDAIVEAAKLYPDELPAQTGSAVYQQCLSFAREDPLLLADWINRHREIDVEIRQAALRALCNTVVEDSPEWVFTWAAALPSKNDRFRLMTMALLAIKERPVPANVRVMIEAAPVAARERRVLLGMIERL